MVATHPQGSAAGAPRRGAALSARATLLAQAALGVLLIASAPIRPARAQIGFDRPGGDYLSFVVRSGDPALCASRCDRDSRCRAWSFSYPTTVGPRAICWLKNSVPPRVESPCCASGVRGVGVLEPRRGASEIGIDRFGGDYRSFDAHADAGSACAAACAADTRCRAWTYVRPGYGLSTARCYLKSRVTPPRRKPCCISGVVR
ncbi:MAG: PAN domain-containing protein [Variibacter sp.]|nr:PAN domain-containing protein [Variibacter sp.]